MRGLLIDDDALFLRTLHRSLQRHGIECEIATSSREALAHVTAQFFDFALVDLKLGKDSGLRLIGPLKSVRENMRIVIMTGYASVATAVEAVKAGAHDYLLKPVRVDAILRALADEPPVSEERESMTPLGRLEWEHIQQALRETDGNISAAARLLGIQRRSLQRKLAKRPAPGAGEPEK